MGFACIIGDVVLLNFLNLIYSCSACVFKWTFFACEKRQYSENKMVNQSERVKEQSKTRWPELKHTGVVLPYWVYFWTTVELPSVTTLDYSYVQVFVWRLK